MRSREDLEKEVVSLRDTVRAQGEELSLLVQVKRTAGFLIRGEATVAQHMSLRDAIERYDGLMEKRREEADERN